MKRKRNNFSTHYLKPGVVKPKDYRNNKLFLKAVGRLLFESLDMSYDLYLARQYQSNSLVVLKVTNDQKIYVDNGRKPPWLININTLNHNYGQIDRWPEWMYKRS